MWVFSVCKSFLCSPVFSYKNSIFCKKWPTQYKFKFLNNEERYRKYFYTFLITKGWSLFWLKMKDIRWKYKELIFFIFNFHFHSSFFITIIYITIKCFFLAFQRYQDKEKRTDIRWDKQGNVPSAQTFGTDFNRFHSHEFF